MLMIRSAQIIKYWISVSEILIFYSIRE